MADIWDFVEIGCILSYNLINTFKWDCVIINTFYLYMKRGFIMDKKCSLNSRIEKLRDEISQEIDRDLYSMTIDDLVKKSNELNQLIVEYHKLINKGTA